MDGSEAGIPIIFHCTSVSYPSTVITVSQFTPRDMWDFSWESGLFDYISSHLKSVRLSERRRDNDIFAACDSISPNHLLFNNFAYGIVRHHSCILPLVRKVICECWFWKGSVRFRLYANPFHFPMVIVVNPIHSRFSFKFYAYLISINKYLACAVSKLKISRYCFILWNKI